MKKLCSLCGKKEAVFFYHESINGKEKEWHLCGDCAKKKGLSNPLQSFAEDLDTFFPTLSPERRSPRGEVCPVCKTTLGEVTKTGLFGCSACYDTFSPHLDLTPFVGQGFLGEGKKAEASKTEIPKKEKKLGILEEKKEALKRAVAAEEYEEAARLRDEIRSLEGK